VVLITSGTSGFGLKTAQRFKQAGDIVIIAARNFEKVKKHS
jgi:short-subunit dehydrogenase involved in D-alanine esterification of teichoic acids